MNVAYAISLTSTFLQAFFAAYQRQWGFALSLAGAGTVMLHMWARLEASK